MNDLLKIKTLEERNHLLTQIKKIDSLLNQPFSPGEESSKAKNGLLFSAAVIHYALGRNEEMLSYLNKLDHSVPFPEPLKQLIEISGLFMPDQRDTPWDHNSVASAYDDYQNLIAHQHLSFDEFFSKTKSGPYRRSICEQVRKYAITGERVLEAGCAAGGYYASLRPFVDVSGYVAVDLTPAMTARTKGLCPELDVARMDVRNLGLASDSFAVVFSTDVLMHIESWKEGLKELYRVTSQTLILRIRTHTHASMPTLVTFIGSGAYHVPYVINNYNEFKDLLLSFNPSPQSIDIVQNHPSAMNKDMWQIADQHPQLLKPFSPRIEVVINYSTDIVIRKRT